MRKHRSSVNFPHWPFIALSRIVPIIIRKYKTFLSHTKMTSITFSKDKLCVRRDNDSSNLFNIFSDAPQFFQRCYYIRRGSFLRNRIMRKQLSLSASPTFVWTCEVLATGIVLSPGFAGKYTDNGLFGTCKQDVPLKRM
jgi:hypothetical protein